jgi:hypothetical protein
MVVRTTLLGLQATGGRDSSLAKWGSVVFWVSILPLAHMALKTVVPGVPEVRKDVGNADGGGG